MTSSGEIIKRIFVYGTLKRGQPNHHVIESRDHGHAKFIANGITVSKWPLVVATPYYIPFVLDAEGEGKVSCGSFYDYKNK